MSRWITFASIAFCVLSLDARPRIRFAGVSVNAGYAYTSGFAPFFPLYGYPFFCFHPGFYNGFAYGPNMGEVRLRTPVKMGAVYLDGAYAGELSKLKHIWLEPGAYNLAIRRDGHAPFDRRIYVLSGKTLDLQPELQP